MERAPRDVFISYAHEDADRARPLAELLEELGWSVWFDHDIPAGGMGTCYVPCNVTVAGTVFTILIIITWFQINYWNSLSPYRR